MAEMLPVFVCTSCANPAFPNKHVSDSKTEIYFSLNNETASILNYSAYTAGASGRILFVPSNMNAFTMDASLSIGASA